MSWASEKIDKIAPAFLEAQKALKGAKKDSANPHLKNKYADLGSVFEACKAELNENGISILQLMGNKDGKNTMQTILMHESGQYFRTEALLPEIDQKGINTAQAMGSAISYMKRYQLQSATGVISEDDDGHAAGQASSPKSSEPAKASAPSIIKDVPYWKGEANKNIAHVVNLRNWYKKHEAEINLLSVKEQDEIKVYVVELKEGLEKQLADKKTSEKTSPDEEALAKDLERGAGDAPPEQIDDVEPF